MWSTSTIELYHFPAEAQRVLAIKDRQIKRRQTMICYNEMNFTVSHVKSLYSKLLLGC